MNIFRCFQLVILLTGTLLISHNQASAQCSFSGLDPTYCLHDPAATLVGDPLGGAFSGPGVSGTTFTPFSAGVGIHTVTYEIPGGGTGEKYYIKAAAGNPWGSTSNQTCMDMAFGPGGWILESFEGAVPGTVFSPSTGLVFMDGSDGQASELNTFLIANMAAIETWVNGGGRLFLNSAPNEGGFIDFGFGGSMLEYTLGVSYTSNVTVVDPAHPAILGPTLPTTTSMSGPYYAHAYVTGSGFTSVITETGNPSHVILFEKDWGAGKVLMGGMTTSNWHSPAPHGTNWRANLLVYLYGELGDPCIVTQEVEVIDAPDVVLTATPDEICLGESIVFTAAGADTYTWSVPGITDGVPYTPVDFGPLTVVLTGSDGICDANDTVIVDVHDTPEADANYDVDGYCLGESIVFVNTTSIGDGASLTWLWNFGDGGTSTATNPSHTYAASGTYTVTLTATSSHGCVDVYTFTVTIHPLPTANFHFSVAGFSSADGATGGCIANPVIFDNLSVIAAPYTIASVNWNFGDGATSTDFEPSHTYGAPGTYTVTLTVTSDKGCVSSFTRTITMTEGLLLTITENEPTCFGFNDGSIVVNVSGATGDVIYSIKNAGGTVLNIDNSNAANTLPSGWYYIDVSDESACSGIDSVFLDQPQELAIDLTRFNILCADDETGWARVDSVYNATGDYNNISFIWNPNPAGVGGVGADSSFNMFAGNYTLTINDDNGCSKVFDFELTEPAPLVFSQFGFDAAYCRLHEYQSGNGVVFGAATGGQADYTYLWTNLDNGDTKINTTWGGLNPGNYQFTVTDANGCVLTETLFLDSLNPIANFTINSDQLNGDYQGIAPVEVSFTNTSLNFANPNNPDADTVFFWNLDKPTADWEITHDYFEVFDTTYLARGQSYTVDVCLVAINKNGCTDTACKTITIFENIVFDNINIFTPNGDGKNDVFTFSYKTASIAEFTCVIVNRWGNVIHEMNDINDEWDGTDKGGNPCPDGVYFYTYKALSDNSTKIEGQGTVQIIRGN